MVQYEMRKRVLDDIHGRGKSGVQTNGLNNAGCMSTGLRYCRSNESQGPRVA